VRGYAKGIGPKYKSLLEGIEVRNWYDNVAQGNKLTAEPLRRLGFICAASGMSPGEMAELARKSDRRSYNLLIGLVRKMLDSAIQARTPRTTRRWSSPG
jgi:hypothetical protein